MDDMEKQPTRVLLGIRENLWEGLRVVGEHFENGTAHTAKSEKDCTPADFASVLTLPLFFKVNTILVNRGEEDFTGRLN